MILFLKLPFMMKITKKCILFSEAPVRPELFKVVLSCSYRLVLGSQYLNSGYFRHTKLMAVTVKGNWPRHNFMCNQNFQKDPIQIDLILKSVIRLRTGYKTRTFLIVIQQSHSAHCFKNIYHRLPQTTHKIVNAIFSTAGSIVYNWST